MANTPIQIRDLSDEVAASSQSFVDLSATIAAPFTTITNRAPMVDITKDLKVSLGVERILTKQLMEIQNEFGPSGQQVWGVVDDPFGMIRFVGDWYSSVGTHGTFADQRAGFSGTNEYVEVTFFGTGLSVLLAYGQNGNTYTYSLDGGAPVNFTPANMSAVLQAQGFDMNQRVNIVSGLSRGLHTLKLNKVLNNALTIYGFEVLNESALLSVNPGQAYLAGTKHILPALTTLPYASVFANSYGTPGSKGGRVIVYLASDGTIKKDIQYVDATQHNVAAATHTNEEVIRVYDWREFGSARPTIDFTLDVNGTVSNLGFVLDDAVTSLMGGSVATVTPALTPATGTNSRVTFTFVGTGLDFLRQDQNNSAIDPHDFYIDGVLIGSPSGGSTALQLQKVVSGLSYGTHTFQLLRNNNASNGVGIRKFYVYGPKTPVLPAAAFQLGSYNLLGNFALQADVTNLRNISQGVIRKNGAREIVYTGSGWAISSNSDVTDGVTIDTASNGDTLTLTFYGTGVAIRAFANPTASVTVAIDGVAYTGSATALTSGAGTWTPGTSTWAVVAGNFAEVLSIQGLALGLHYITLTVASGTFRFQCIDVTTPVYSPAAPRYNTIQNVATVGSNWLSDDRVLSPSLLSPVSTKATGQSTMVFAYSVGNLSSVYFPTQLVSVFRVRKNRARFNYSIVWRNDTIGSNVSFALYVDGFRIPAGNNDFIAEEAGTQYWVTTAETDMIPVSPGFHVFQVWFYTTGGTTLLTAGKFTIEEL